MPHELLLVALTEAEGGPIVVQIGWGGPSTGHTPLFIVLVSPCRCEPLRVGCCGREEVLGVS